MNTSFRKSTRNIAFQGCSNATSYLKKSVQLSLFIFLSFCITDVHAQLDTTFYFAAPDLLTPYDKPVFVRVTTLKKPATVTISMPADPTFIPITQDIAANSVYSFDLTSQLAKIENVGSNLITNKGIKISASQKILALYEPGNQYNPDIFSLKGNNALGTDFIITTQKTWKSQPNKSYIVATEDNTTVQIKPKVNLVGHGKDTTFTIMLNKCQVYIAAAAGTNGVDQMGGTEVSSDKPITITMVTDLTEVPPVCGDLNGDQLVPESKGGTTFITLPGGLNVSGTTDAIYIYAINNNTEITLNNTKVDTINRGEYYVYLNKGAVNYITTSDNVLVYQVAGFGCEVGGGVVPHLQCTGSTSVGVVRSSNEAFKVNILVKSGGESTFKYNGNATYFTAADFANVPGTNGTWKYTSKTISTSDLGVGKGAIINNTQPFHLGVIHGSGAGGTRYGYFSAFGGLEAEIDLSSEAGEATLSTTLTGISYKWFVDSTEVVGATNQIHKTYKGGSYYVEVTYDALCPPARSESVIFRPDIVLNEGLLTKTICIADTFEIPYLSNVKLNSSNIAGYRLQVSIGHDRYFLDRISQYD